MAHALLQRGQMKRMLSMLVLVLGCSGSSHGDSQPDTNAQLTCSGLSEADCAHASDCHLVFTDDEPCDNLCCASHFDRCAAASSVNCNAHRTGVCNGSCATIASVCSGSLVQGYTDDGCCPAGCVAISQCAGVTEAPSSQCPSGHEDTLQLPTGAKMACDPVHAADAAAPANYSITTLLIGAMFVPAGYA
jgi:hypothetical protein